MRRSVRADAPQDLFGGGGEAGGYLWNADGRSGGGVRGGRGGGRGRLQRSQRRGGGGGLSGCGGPWVGRRRVAGLTVVWVCAGGLFKRHGRPGSRVRQVGRRVIRAMDACEQLSGGGGVLAGCADELSVEPPRAGAIMISAYPPAASQCAAVIAPASTSLHLASFSAHNRLTSILHMLHGLRSTSCIRCGAEPCPKSTPNAPPAINEPAYWFRPLHPHSAGSQCLPRSCQPCLSTLRSCAGLRPT